MSTHCYQQSVEWCHVCQRTETKLSFVVECHTAVVEISQLFRVVLQSLINHSLRAFDDKSTDRTTSE